MEEIVNVHSGADAVRAYIKEQAALGREHVEALIKADRDAIRDLTADVTEDEANFQPAEGEFSISQVVQHLNVSFPRSHARLQAMIAGEDFCLDGPTRSHGRPT